MNNYEFCAQWVRDQDRVNTIRVLDYGCGAGEIVSLLRKQEINAFGCDVFYQGGDLSTHIPPRLFDGIIRRMEGNTIPFESDYFDFVINNYVMEHVEHLDSALWEIARVLKPGGVVLSLFPYKKVWREGHSGVPLLHWFPKGSRSRIYYAAAWRVLGFGRHKNNKSILRWSLDFCEWLDKWTYYRTQQEIEAAYGTCFCEIQHIEDYWLQQRLGELKAAAALLPSTLQRLLVRKLSGLVFIACKPKG